MREKKPFDYAAVGGTFDRLHKGHLELLQAAFRVANHVSIGLTTEIMHKKKENFHEIQSFTQRKEQIEQFLTKFNIDPNNYDIFSLTDPYGPTITEEKFDVLIVSDETYNGGRKINQIRLSKGLSQMILLSIPIVHDEDDEKLSSTKIRARS